MAKDNFATALAHVFAQEGGYVDNPLDPGGATKFGITRRVLAEQRGRPVSKAEVIALTQREAATIYYEQYWLPSGAEALPAGLDLIVFDTAVNSGVRRARKLLADVQASLPDGPGTSVSDQIDAYALRRLGFLRRLSNFAIFGRGWRRRVDATAKAARQLSQNQ